MMLIRCIGYLLCGFCNCCSKDVPALSVCSGSSQGCLTWSGPSTLRQPSRCVGGCGSVPPALPDGDNGLFWDFPFLESALWVPLLWEGSWSVLCLSTFLGWLLISPWLCRLSGSGWLVAPTKTLTLLGPPQLGHNLSLSAAQAELGERQAV